MKKIIIVGLALLSTLAHANEITISKGVIKTYRNKLEDDFVALENFEFQGKGTQDTLDVLGLKELTSETALKWLTQRVHYIVEDQKFTTFKDLFLRDILFVTNTNMDYSNLVNPDNVNQTEGSPDTPVVSMSNLGASLYGLGKDGNALLGFKVNKGLLHTKEAVVIKSPRVGIIQIGAGLFREESTINSDDNHAVSDSIYRLSTLFHEARHSDGHGDSLSFKHSVCPKGSDYVGVAACDENFNGPYMVGATMLLEMKDACGDKCSPREGEILNILALDSLSRVQKITSKGKRSKDWDATPESL